MQVPEQLVWPNVQLVPNGIRCDCKWRLRNLRDRIQRTELLVDVHDGELQQPRCERYWHESFWLCLYLQIVLARGRLLRVPCRLQCIE